MINQLHIANPDTQLERLMKSMQSIIPLSALLFGSACASPAAIGEISISRAGSQPSVAGPASSFTGQVQLGPTFSSPAPATAGGGLVSFEAGARTAWHTHPLGQILIVTDGVGWVQEWNTPIHEIRRGDIVKIPPHVKHWHGASTTSRMSHIAIAEKLDGKSVTWLEQVSEDQYLGSPILIP